MEESDADLAAGRIVPAAVVLAELHASVTRLEAQRTDAGRAAPEAEHSAVPRRS